MLRWTAAAAAVLLTLVVGAPAGAVVQVVDTWSYSPTVHQLVAAGGGAPFSIVGGTPVQDATGAAVRFSAAPGAAVQTAEPFVVPGSADFRYEAVVGVDRLRASSTPNVFQYGRYDGHQVKLQLSAKGVPQCVFNGSGGRLKLTSRSPSLNDGGRPHTFACWRTGGTVGATVDGATTSRVFALGTVTPVGLATAGNRSATGKAADQLFGRIWSVSVSLG